MIGRFRADGTILFANAAYARACGFAGSDMRGANLREVLSPERSKYFEKHLATLTPTLSEVRFEERVDTLVGEGWTLWKFFALDFDDRGLCREVEVIGIDITEAKRAQNELLATNVRLRLAERDLNRAQAVAQIGSWRLDGGSGHYEWSDETYRIFAIPQSTPPTYDMFVAAVHPDDRASVERAWYSANQDKTDHDVEHRIIANGVVKWVHERAALSWDGDGNLLEAWGTCQDITERKDWEIALERRVLERTEAVSVARDEATRANAEKSKFLSAASHDLRQPLHAAVLYASALRRRLATTEQIEMCDKIEQALDSTSEMLRTLLDVSRLESGAVMPEPRAFVVQDLIDRVIANSQALLDEKGLRIVNTPSDLVGCSDPGLFERIIDNFVTNAVRYTDAGGTITISCVRTGAGVRVAVQDTGVGIPEEALDRIFDEYVQIDNAARTRAKGLGLGLAIAKHIASLLGCRLSVVSRVGHGSTFSVETQSANLAPGPAALRLYEPPDTVRSERPLLLIEDDLMVADAVTMVLSDAGFVVTHAASGEDALASLAEGFTPILIVSDYWLPRANGVDLIGRLRAALGVTVPALLVTGDSTLRVGAVGLEQCYVVHKPLDAQQLTGVLRQLAAA